MAKVPVEEILQSLSKALNAMPNVFSTPQWGGRAYKLPGPGSRGVRKPVLLTHVSIPKSREAVCLGFRLQLPRAKAVVRQHKFIKPSTFGTLGRNGWLEMALTTKAQCRIVIGLLKESRALHPMSDAAAASIGSKPSRNHKRGAAAAGEVDGVMSRMDTVLQQKREEGWTPSRDDDFDAI